MLLPHRIKGLCAYLINTRVYISFSQEWQLLIQDTNHLLGVWQRLATHISRKSLVAEPKLTSSWRATENPLLAILKLINVPSGEDNLVFKKFCFGRDDPDKEIGRKRDC